MGVIKGSKKGDGITMLSYKYIKQSFNSVSLFNN